MNENSLKAIASEIRKLSLSAIYHAESGHPGGALSCADIVAYLYEYVVDLHSSNRLNRLVLSKGHAAPVIYAAAVTQGVISAGNEKTLRKLGSKLQGHPDVNAFNWLETSTGSLGQGFSVAIGMSLGLMYKKASGTIYALLGDGELQEGQIWEGAMFAAHHGLGNMCAIVDYNKLQSDDLNKNIINIEPLADKWSSFGWQVLEIDGHDFSQIKAAIGAANKTSNKPSAIIAHTIKGKGVSFMEGVPAWHGSVAIKKSELEKALIELGASGADVDNYL